MSQAKPQGKPDLRLAALRRFATAITVFNLLGHTLFGFEQSWAQPIVGVLTAYATEILLELVLARVQGRRPRFAGGLVERVNFLLSAHISGLAVSMLLYPNERLLPIAFAAATAIASKHIFRVATAKRSCHFLNPSNFGITASLLLFPWVSIAQPYMFTENLSGAGDWILPAVIVASGSFLNTRFTKKIPLIAGWLGGFLVQAAARSLVFGSPLVPKLLPMTGVAFVLFTFYMVSDPATTPVKPRNQVLFGAAVALAYGALVSVHVVFGLFFALSLVCFSRGLGLYAVERLAQRGRVAAPVPATAAAIEASNA
jgi:enediyne biosynthesis protein E5